MSSAAPLPEPHEPTPPESITTTPAASPEEEPWLADLAEEEEAIPVELAEPLDDEDEFRRRLRVRRPAPPAPPHPGFWWAILWCILMLIVAQIVPALLVVTVLVVIALVRGGLAGLDEFARAAQQDV